MENVMQKFEKLMMSQKFDFLECFISIEGPRNPETKVVELYNEVKKLPKHEQDAIGEQVKNWAFSLTREEMFLGAKEEKMERSQKVKKE